MIDNYSFELLKRENLSKILLLRNQKKVREASFNTKIIGKKECEEWFDAKIKKSAFNHYVLKHNKKLIGLGYGEKLPKKKSYLWGFYLDLKIKSPIKYGSIIKYLLFEKLLNNPNVNQIECQVKKDFEWIKDWHIRWGHEVYNYDDKLNCYNLVLRKKIWQNIKYKIYEKGFGKN